VSWAGLRAREVGIAATSVSMRVNQPDHPWPPLEEQVERFLTKLVGVPPASP
jgi:hypothetical protein